MTSGFRVLIVEDDPSISRLLELELRHRGMEIQVAADGLAGLTHAERHRHDVILLDILLPVMDGERMLARLRQQGVRTPVIMLTARDGDRDKIRNLEAGADDYLTKPYNVDELVARIRAVLRRVQPDPVLRVADLELNLATREVHRDGAAVELTAREYDLLVFLAQNARQVLSRTRIIERIWSENPDVDPNVLDVYIGYLRRKLDRPGQPRLIQTVRGVGYTLRES
ncbi:MAG TPA: response regulator transcription factor [Thermomicrobiales bacterium]|nr:response regulator transcription factor [Thermomicrobiales bacterium]